MAIEQQNNQAQPMAQRQPVSDDGGQMAMESEQEQGQIKNSKYNNLQKKFNN